MPTRRTLLAAAALASQLAAPVKLLRHAAAQGATPEGLTLPGTPTGEQWLAQWSPGQTAKINGAALYYEDHCDPAGHPVLLLHGGLANSESWLNVAPVLAAAGYRVIMLDSRGHGLSAWGDLPITYDQMTADALGLLDHLGIAKTDVVGWSDGGIIALNLAIHHPERLDRVVAYGANFTPDGTQFVPTDQFPPFERLIVDYRRLAPQPERFEELSEVLFALYEVAPELQRGRVAQHQRAGPDPGWGRGGTGHARPAAADG
jgi:pimeloyl-ACP methyl ester carboxylesterase